MFQKDYIMRLIEQLSNILIKIIFNRETGNYAQALKELDLAYRNLLGADPIKLDNMTELELIENFQNEDECDSEKLIVIAELMREHAIISEIENGMDLYTFRKFLKSLTAYLFALQCDVSFQRDEYHNKIGNLINKLKLYSLPNHLHYRIFIYYMDTGQFAKAEDSLFQLYELDYHSVADVGHDFYNQLMKMSDEKLIKGNLPRKEVAEGQKLFNEMINNRK